jgi:hypothetical protein
MEDFPRAFAFRGVMGFQWFDEGRGEIQGGLMCGGCFRFEERDKVRMNLDRSLKRERAIVDMKVSKRAWTVEEFLMHAEACDGAQHILIQYQR